MLTQCLRCVKDGKWTHSRGGMTLLQARAAGQSLNKAQIDLAGQGIIRWGAEAAVVTNAVTCVRVTCQWSTIRCIREFCVTSTSRQQSSTEQNAGGIQSQRYQ